MRPAVLLGALCLAVPGRGAVLLNEIAFDEPPGSPDWVELYNAGPGPVSLDGWRLTDGDAAAGNEVRISLSTPVPVGAFVRVLVDAVGVDETDFSDGSATVFSGTAPTVALAATEDEVGLYTGLPLSSATIVDFTAWVTDGAYGGTADQADAVAAGLWTGGDAVALTDPGQGYSLGRRRDGLDTNGVSDWVFFSRPTPARSNLPPAAPFASALRVDPALQAFSPFDGDPAFRVTRFFYNVGNPAVVKSIAIYDVRGRRLRTLLEHDRGPGGEDHAGLASGSLFWDGRDQEGVIVPAGVYVVVLDGADPATGGSVRGRDVVAVGRPR